MNKAMKTTLFGLGGLMFLGVVRATESNGLYYISTDETAQSIMADDGSTARLGGKAEIQILKAHVYSENDENTDFGVRLDTSNYPVNPKTGSPARQVALRVGNHGHISNGGGGHTGLYNVMFFKIHGEDDAKNAARCLSVECALRSPPGYKILSQFVPAKSEFQANGPVLVKFLIKNLDDRTIVFQRGGQQRGPRDNQYGFRAMLTGSAGASSPIQPVADTGNPLNHGGLGGLVKLEPGKTFEDQIDLKKWFSFDKAGTYLIHGFYGLTYYRQSDTEESYMPWNELWNDYASADFVVMVK